MNGTLPNTTQTNYATDYAIVEKMYSVYSGVWHELGYTWEDFLSWSDGVHIPAMQVPTLRFGTLHYNDPGYTEPICCLCPLDAVLFSGLCGKEAPPPFPKNTVILPFTTPLHHTTKLLHYTPTLDQQSTPIFDTTTLHYYTTCILYTTTLHY